MMPPVITLSPTTREDLLTLFHFQRDPQAAHVAAFTSPDSADQPAYLAKYAAFLTDPTITMRTIRANGALAGSIAAFERAGQVEVTYWIDRHWWGQGVATRALAQVVALEPRRPLCGRVAGDNRGSQRVLEKCGFVKIGTDRALPTPGRRKSTNIFTSFPGKARKGLPPIGPFY